MTESTGREGQAYPWDRSGGLWRRVLEYMRWHANPRAYALESQVEALRVERDDLKRFFDLATVEGGFQWDVLMAGVKGLHDRVEALTNERDGWRRLAVLHGAEVQADNEYLLRRHEPLEAENNQLIKVVGEEGDKRRQAEAEAAALRGKVALADEAALRLREQAGYDNFFTVSAGIGFKGYAEADLNFTPAYHDWLARYDALTASAPATAATCDAPPPLEHPNWTCVEPAGHTGRHRHAFKDYKTWAPATAAEEGKDAQ